MRQAKSQCEKLIVAVGTDEFMKERKKRDPIFTFSQRVKIVEAVRYVDQVVEETDLDKIAYYKKYEFDVIFAGDDHKQEPVYINAVSILKQEYGVDTIYIKRSEISSTMIRKRIKGMELE